MTKQFFAVLVFVLGAVAAQSASACSGNDFRVSRQGDHGSTIVGAHGDCDEIRLDQFDDETRADVRVIGDKTRVGATVFRDGTVFEGVFRGDRMSWDGLVGSNGGVRTWGAGRDRIFLGR